MLPTKHTYALALSALLLCLVAGGYAFMLYTIKVKSEKLSILAQELETGTAREERLRAAASLVEDTALERAELEQRFVRGESLVEFLEVVERAGADVGTSVEVKSVSVEPLLIASATDAAATSTAKNKTKMQAHPTLEHLVLTIMAEGSYAEVFRFLELVESLPYRTEVRKTSLEVALEASGERSGGWQGTYEFVVLKTK